MVIDWTGSGSQYLPWAARVANTSAISIGVASLTPSVNEPHPSAWSGWAIFRSTSVRQRSPSRSAIRTAFAAPTFCSSWTKYVFTDLPNTLHMVCRPTIDSVEFFGHQCTWSPHDDGPGPVMYFDRNTIGALNDVDSGMPLSSAASMVKILNVDPAWYPAIVPPPSSGLTVFG